MLEVKAPRNDELFGFHESYASFVGFIDAGKLKTKEPCV